MIVVVDLDGTLCDSGHREHLARAKQWDEFHSLLCDDEPHEDVLKLLRTLASGDAESPLIVGLTGRNDRYRPSTLHWLMKHNVPLDDLLMRPDTNFKPDHEMKPEILDQWLSENGHTHSDVWFILEDRDKVVEAWRNLGHNCWQCRPGGY